MTRRRSTSHSVSRIPKAPKKRGKPWFFICREIICQIQGKDPNEGYQTEAEEDKLPLPNFDNLQQIVEDITSVNDLMRKRKISTQLLSENVHQNFNSSFQSQYVRKVCSLFDQAEGLEAQEHLFYLFHLFKGMLSLGDTKLIETLLSKEFFMFTLGALEYDPEVFQNGAGDHGNDSQELPMEAEVQQPQVLKHRSFLQNELKFKQVVNIEDENVLDSIHLVYRLTYLKDTAIARFIDDSVLANINQLIYIKSQDIINHIFYNKDILVELLQKMRSQGDLHTKHDAIEFFMEVC